MQRDIHPDYHPVVFVDDEFELVTRSTLTSGETRTIDGVEHYVVRLDISSNSHPFWTGQQRFVDSEGRVERFRAKYARARNRGGAKKKADDEPKPPASEAAGEEAASEEAASEAGQAATESESTDAE